MSTIFIDQTYAYHNNNNNNNNNNNVLVGNKGSTGTNQVMTAAVALYTHTYIKCICVHVMFM
jgi:hypothetical protein